MARRAWRLLHQDASAARAAAEQALALVATGDDALAEGWARLTRGMHVLYFANPAEASAELQRAQAAFDRAGHRAGHILAAAGQARALWRDGQFARAVDTVLPLRDEGLRVLRNEERSVLLNTIAGCYAARRDSEQAFAYLYEALRDAGPSHGHGFDVVLHCNLAHELLQLGDYHEALRYIERGLERCDARPNPRVASLLLINRAVCLTELGRAAEALPDLHTVVAMPTDASGRGAVALHFETLAIAAFLGGAAELGRSLRAQAERTVRPALPDEVLELAIARALDARSRGDVPAALAALAAARDLAAGVEGSSLRVRCRYQQTLSDLQAEQGDSAAALAALRVWQQLHLERMDMASRARYQAAALQTELLRLRQRIDEKDAQRRSTERARAELQHANEQLSRTVHEVQALQQALREQATRDALTGLFNRRHLNETLPAMLALAQRERQPLALVLIDLDHFKAVNDSHGHAAGDTLLAAFGRLLADSGRASDVACRYGGEEFCLLLPNTDAAAARRKVQALLRRWQAMRFTTGRTTLTRQGFSAGVTDSARAGGSAEALLRSADDELLEAKRQGRGRVGLAAAAPAPRSDAA